MRKHTVVIKDEIFEGEIKLKVLNQFERLQAIKEMQLNITAQEGVSVSTDQIDAADKIYRFLKEKVEEVSVKILESGEVLTSLDDLTCFAEGTEIVNQLTHTLLSGVKLGKTLEPS